MKVELVRTGASPSSRAKQYGDGWRHAADTGWRTWAYEQAVERNVALVAPVVVTFTPTGRTRGVLTKIESAWPAAQLVFEGLFAGGMLPAGRGGVVEMRVRAPRVTGHDGMIVELADGFEPF